MDPAAAVSLYGVYKRFGETVALENAHLEVRVGEVHVLLGENGAGKSSLISVAAGLYSPDAGTMVVADREVIVKSPADALSLGIVLVPQHPELIPNLSCWENVILGNEGRALLSRKALRRRVSSLARENSIDLPLDEPVNRLSAGEQLKVELLKMLHRNAKVLILDEPTTFLTPQESDGLLRTLDVLTDRGIGVVLVTHKLRDAIRVGHRLSVMRNGAVLATLNRGEAEIDDLIRLVTGSERPTSDVESAEIGAVDSESRRGSIENETPGIDTNAKAPILSIKGLSTDEGVSLDNVSLSLSPGDIYGLAGVAGNGQRELAETILGIIPATSGAITLNGQEITRWSVTRRLAAGLGVIPEDRHRDGILPSANLWENFALGSHDQLFGRLNLQSSAAEDLTHSAIERFDIKAPSASAIVSRLSGGNIQKIIVARALYQAAAHQHFVLVALYPTRGLDVATAARVWEGLRQIANAGGVILVVSEDLDELMTMCGSISVLYRGAIVADFPSTEYSRYDIGEAMLGHIHEPAISDSKAAVDGREVNTNNE